jgi:hypothetical protein
MFHRRVCSRKHSLHFEWTNAGLIWSGHYYEDVVKDWWRRINNHTNTWAVAVNLVHHWRFEVIARSISATQGKLHRDTRLCWENFRLKGDNNNTRAVTKGPSLDLVWLGRVRIAIDWDCHLTMEASTSKEASPAKSNVIVNHFNQQRYNSWLTQLT